MSDNIQNTITGRFLCGGYQTLTAFCPLAGQLQTRQKGYILELIYQ